MPLSSFWTCTNHQPVTANQMTSILLVQPPAPEFACLLYGSGAYTLSGRNKFIECR